MSAGALTKEHHLARNGAGPRGSVKREGSGRFNWGTSADQVRDVEYLDDVDVSGGTLQDDPLSQPARPPAKVNASVAEPEAFEKAKRNSSP
ncbi:hypothetical protein LPJ61_005833, partial [Coemansia biformis]